MNGGEPGAGTKGMGVYLVHLDELGRPPEKTSVGIHRRLAGEDRFGVHRLVDDPEDADVVLFTECHLLGDWRLPVIRDHPLRTRFADRTYCFNERSRPWAVLPGLYTSPPVRTLDRRFQVPWGYPGGSKTRATLVASRDTCEPDTLYSFVGSPGPACRDRIFSISDPRAIVERIDGFTFFDRNSPDRAQRVDHYQQITLRSKFVLCPRGLATSSIRLYETLAAGRVPVIFSDEWAEPAGPDWASFSIRWPEARADQIGPHLAAREDEWPAMARAARQAYDDWFATDVTFHRSMEALRPLVDGHVASSFPPRGLRNREYYAVALNETARNSRGKAVRARNWLRGLVRRGS